VFKHACTLGCEGIVSKGLGSRYVSGRCRDWIKSKNPNAPAVKREAEEDWDKSGGDETRRLRAESRARGHRQPIEARRTIAVRQSF
jgi:hypothetical protein